MIDHIPSWLPFGGLALLIPFWQQAKSIALRFRAIFIIRVTIRGEAAPAVSASILRTFKRVSYIDLTYQTFLEYVKPLSKTTNVVVEIRPTTKAGLYRRGWRFVLIDSALQNPSRGDSEYGTNTLNLSFIRGTFRPDDLVVEGVVDARKFLTTGASRFRIERMEGTLLKSQYGSNSISTPETVAGNSCEDVLRYRDGRVLEFGWDDLGQPNPADPLAHLVHGPDTSVIVNEFRQWLASENWFKQRLLPWRRGWLLYGLPGTGKSSLVKALAQLGGMPLFVFDLSGMTNHDLVGDWKSASSNAPCIVLIEDMDTVFAGRKNIASGNVPGHLTFDCLLNTISGVNSSEGVFLVVTTNDVSSIDDALGVPDAQGLSTRPGRLDRMFEIPALDEDCRRRLAARILCDWPDMVEQAVIDSTGFTAARVMELCSSRALAKFWEK